MPSTSAIVAVLLCLDCASARRAGLCHHLAERTSEITGLLESVAEDDVFIESIDTRRCGHGK